MPSAPSERSPSDVRPDRAALLRDFGEEYLSIPSLFSFCFVPGGRLAFLRELVASEEWGGNHFVLLKYLAVHVRLAIEQGAYVWNGEQIVLTSGRLGTSNGNPVYLGLVRNQNPDENPWVLNWVGERPSATELPEPPVLGEWPELDATSEVVVGYDLDSDKGRARVPLLASLPLATQHAALSGAISWALRRDLAVRQIFGGGRGYLVPVFLGTRDDLNEPPDLVAHLVLQRERIVARNLFEPHVAYSSARACVERWEQLPTWLVASWEEAVEGGDASNPRTAEDHA